MIKAIFEAVVFLCCLATLFLFMLVLEAAMYV